MRRWIAVRISLLSICCCFFNCYVMHLCFFFSDNCKRPARRDQPIYIRFIYPRAAKSLQMPQSLQSTLINANLQVVSTLQYFLLWRSLWDKLQRSDAPFASAFTAISQCPVWVNLQRFHDAPFASIYRDFMIPHLRQFAEISWCPVCHSCLCGLHTKIEQIRPTKTKTLDTRFEYQDSIQLKTELINVDTLIRF